MNTTSLPLTRPDFTVTINLNEPVPETGSGELQKRMDLVLNELELIRTDCTDLLNHSISTYRGNPSMDPERLKAEIIKQLSEQGIATDGPRPRALITAVWTMRA